MAKSTTKVVEDINNKNDKIIDNVSEVENQIVSGTQRENEELKKQIANMQAQMDLLMKNLVNNNNKQNEKKKERNITFINMTNGVLILKGSSYWKFEGQFAQRNFLEREARLIVSNMPNTIRSGMVYIADAEFVEENDLAETYQYLLTDKELKELLSKDYNFVVDAYKNACQAQKDIIVDMIVNGRMQGKRIDGNILLELGKLSGKDFMSIEEMSLEDEKAK